MHYRECLIVFTRFPEPGTTKTRLIPRLGSRGAADLQRRMTEHVLAQARPLRDVRGADLEVRYDGGNAAGMRTWLGEDLAYVRQGAGDIGARMARALRDAMAQGYDAMVLIGSDIPGISTALVQRAFEALAGAPVVLGPASDGGYYLIGLSRDMKQADLPALFAGMPWGSSAVLADTCRRLRRLGCPYILLETLDDVDRPEDLPVWERFNPNIA